MKPKESQQKRILSALKRKPMTGFEMVTKLFIMSWWKRISELREAGHPITDKWRTLPSGTRIKVYTLSR